MYVYIYSTMFNTLGSVVHIAMHVLHVHVDPAGTRILGYDI